MLAHDRVEALFMHGRVEHAPQIGGEGYALPRLDSLEWRPVGDPDHDNWLVCEPSADPKLTISFFGCKNNTILYGTGCNLYGTISCMTNGAMIIFGENTGPGSSAAIGIFGSGDNGFFFFGARSTVNQAGFWMHGDDARVIFGEDCMLAHAISVRSGDDHSIIDMVTGAFTNPPRSIFVEPHVWICPEAHILKGSVIGFGSIVAAKSIVSRTFPRFSMIGGQLQRVLKADVSWDRPQVPRPGTRDMLKDWAAGIADITGPGGLS